MEKYVGVASQFYDYFSVEKLPTTTPRYFNFEMNLSISRLKCQFSKNRINELSQVLFILKPQQLLP